MNMRNILETTFYEMIKNEHGADNAVFDLTDQEVREWAESIAHGETYFSYSVGPTGIYMPCLRV